MIFYLKKTPKLIKKNIEILFLFFLIIITIISTTYYNANKKLTNENYYGVINNIYFQKTINYIFDNLTPRYKSINHKISNGETFDKILNSYSIESSEIIKIKKELNLNNNLNKLKTNLNIEFIIDESNNKKITFFLYPVSRTEQIQLIRNLETDFFEKKQIITNLNKRIKNCTEFV